MVLSRGIPPRRALFALSVGAVVILSVAATAWACVPFASLRVTPTDVQPGQEVSLTGAQFRPGVPVVIRLDSLDGPELATVMVDSPKGPFFQSTVVIPPDVSTGTHVLVATQQTPEWGGPGWGIPARAVITVGHPSPLGPAPPLAPRTAELSRESVGPMAFLLVTLGVAAVALLGFGGVAVVVSTRAGRRSPARVSS
jgi:hypothetical protein